MTRIKDRILLIIDVLRSSFISLVPYYILYSSVLLVLELFKHFDIFPSFFSIEDSYNLVELLSSLLPLLLNISISYHLTSLYFTNVNKFLTIILSLIIYLSVEIIVNAVSVESYIFPNSVILGILIPLLTNFLISNFIKILKPYQDKLNVTLSNNIATMIIYIIPFILIFFANTLIFSTLYIIFNIGNNLTLFDQGYETLLLFIRTISSNFLWLFGIHGINFFDTIINVESLDKFIFNNLTYKDFFNLFIVLGGSGAGLSLVLAIFISSRDKHTTFIGKISLPFVIFNINEILIFGIPIFMNFSLIIPFIIVPIFNFLISYLFLSYTDLIVFYEIFIPWTTPALINMYLISDGNLIAVFLQLSLILLGALIYIPFIKKYSQKQSSTILLEKMARKFDISTDLESKRDIRFQEAQASLINSHYKINKIIDRINQDNLLLYYQAKIDIKNKSCNSFEALLRIKDENSNIKGPDFIIDIENSGLASIIDIWVCKEVKKDINLWRENNFNPNISINIFPYTLGDENYLREIIRILHGYNITFEVIERRSFLNKNIFNNIKLLKENGFKISLDDLGIGYTNFSVLYELPFDNVKIDRKIISFTHTKKGLILYENICKLCSQLGFKIVLEGIETKEELDKLMNKDIDYIQGWYFSKALAFNDVQNFVSRFKI